MARHHDRCTAATAIEDRPALVATLADSTTGLSLGHLRSFLDRECANDPALRAEVERLIVERETFVDPSRTSPAHASSLVTGDIVAGRYRIARLIGRGGMGEVYEAEDRLLDERVALKTLRADLAGRESLLARFQEEILLARKVTHPNVCRIFEVGVHDLPGHASLLFFAMELLEGDTLAARIRSGRLTRAEAFPLAVQMADGLQAAHDAGIVHADFKSSNVVLVPERGGTRAVITDFGLARLDPSRASVDDTRTLAELRLAGTLAYMSPEQLKGDRITSASDIYSFGVVLFEMAAGSLPFDEGDLIKAAMLKASSDPIAVRARVPDIDHRWESAIARCLEKDPQRRFLSAGALAIWFTDRKWFDVHRWTPREWIGVAAALLLSIGLAIASWLWWTQPYVPLPEARAAYDAGMHALHSMTYETARQSLERAVAADPKFALAHAGLARAYDELDYTDRAKDEILRALAAAQDTRLSGDDERRLRATQYAVSRDYARAAPLFRMMEEAASPREQPSAALESGWLAQQMDDSNLARSAFERALGFDATYAAAKLRLGFLLGRQGGKDDTALAAFTDAEHLYRLTGDSEGITQTLFERANLLNRRSRSRDALPVIDNALMLAHTVGNRYQEIKLQLLQGTAYRNLGDTARATERVRAAIEAAVAENMDNVATNALIDLGNTHLITGNYDAAEPYFRRALDTARRVKIRRVEARAQLAMASLCERDHRPEESRTFAEAALAFYNQAGYRRESVQAAVVLGGVLQQLGRSEEGLRMLTGALPAAERLQDRRLEAQLRDRIGDNLLDRGDWPGALDAYQRALSLYGTGIQAASLNVISARLQRRLGRSDDAHRSLATARQFESKTPNPSLRRAILVELGEIAYADGRLVDALQLARQAEAAMGPGEPAPEATVLRARTRIRMGGAANALPPVGAAIDRLERTTSLADAAMARLSVAEALIAAGYRSDAMRLARDALAYFEPRAVWEATWRGHAIASAASESSTDAAQHRDAARSAMTQLEQTWSAADLDRYLARSDIGTLSAGLRTQAPRRP